jgi:hypothetical protein
VDADTIGVTAGLDIVPRPDALIGAAPMLVILPDWSAWDGRTTETIPARLQRRRPG